MIRRNIVVRIRVTEKEYEHMVRQAKEDKETSTRSGKENMSAYIRKCVLNQSGYRRKNEIKVELENLSYQIRKIGININQAVKQINTNFYDENTTERLYEGLEQVNEKMESLLEKLGGSNGNNKTNEH